MDWGVGFRVSVKSTGLVTYLSGGSPSNVRAPFLGVFMTRIIA